MNRKNTSIVLRAVVAAALCFSFIIYFPLRASSAVPVARLVTVPKSESQFRTEASRYGGAIRAISGIASMKLETTGDLKQAIAIIDRERANLNLFFSKLVVLSLSDSTFTNAVKKKIPNSQAAELFAKELEADRNALLKLDGAQALATRLRQSAGADSAILRRAGDRLKEAAGKIKEEGQGRMLKGVDHSDEIKVIRVGFSDAMGPDPGAAALIFIPELLIGVFFVVAVLIIGALYARLILRTREEDEGQALSDCVGVADNRLSNCLADANIFTIALCYAQNLLDKAVCLAT